MHFITENWLVAWFSLLFFLEVLIYKDIILTGKIKKYWGGKYFKFYCDKVSQYITHRPFAIYFI